MKRLPRSPRRKKGFLPAPKQLPENVLDSPHEAEERKDESPAPDEPSVPQELASNVEDAASHALKESPASLDEDNEEKDEAEGAHMSLREHLTELRSRLVRSVLGVMVGFVAVFSFAPSIRGIIESTLKATLPPGGEITFADLTEPFMVDMHLAFVLGSFVASPYIFYQIWAFIAPGLYESERKYVMPVALCSALFFIGGGAFCYFVVIPFTFKFFIGYGSGSAKPLITLANMYRFSLKLLLAFGIMFEMPLFSFFLTKLRIVTADRLRAWRKYAILVNFVVAALITPPDVLSQLLLAGPLILLYELSILVAKFAAPSRKKAETAETGAPPAAG